MGKVGFPILMLAGLCGGLAEVVWVASYSVATGLNGLEVARQVTATVFPTAADNSWAPLFGVVIHFVLSIGLAIAFGWIVWRPFSHKLNRVTGTLVGIAVLCLLWAMNFVVVLPALNPAFVTLMPYPVTLLSKALFGAAMVWMLQAGSGIAERDSAAYARWILIGICRASRFSRRIGSVVPRIELHRSDLLADQRRP